MNRCPPGRADGEEQERCREGRGVCCLPLAAVPCPAWSLLGAPRCPWDTSPPTPELPQEEAQDLGGVPLLWGAPKLRWGRSWHGLLSCSTLGGLFCPLWCVLGWGRMVLGGPARGSCIPLPPCPWGQHPMQHSRRHGHSVPTAVPPPQPQGQPSPLPLPWGDPRASGTRSRDAALAASRGPRPSAICSGAGGRAVLTSCWSQGTCELRQRPEKSLR